MMGSRSYNKYKSGKCFILQFKNRSADGWPQTTKVLIFKRSAKRVDRRRVDIGSVAEGLPSKLGTDSVASTGGGRIPDQSRRGYIGSLPTRLRIFVVNLVKIYIIKANLVFEESLPRLASYLRSFGKDRVLNSSTLGRPARPSVARPAGSARQPGSAARRWRESLSVSRDVSDIPDDTVNHILFSIY